MPFALLLAPPDPAPTLVLLLAFVLPDAALCGLLLLTDMLVVLFTCVTVRVVAVLTTGELGPRVLILPPDEPGFEGLFGC